MDGWKPQLCQCHPLELPYKSLRLLPLAQKTVRCNLWAAKSWGSGPGLAPGLSASLWSLGTWRWRSSWRPAARAWAWWPRTCGGRISRRTGDLGRAVRGAPKRMAVAWPMASPFWGGTSICQLFWRSPAVQGFDPQPN